MADNHMVKNPDIHQPQRFFQAPGQGYVGLAGLCHPRGVIVGKYYGRRIELQCLPDHLPGIHGCTVYGAPEQFPVLDHPVAIVEEKPRENFMGVGAKPATQKAACVFW